MFLKNDGFIAVSVTSLPACGFLLVFYNKTYLPTYSNQLMTALKCMFFSGMGVVGQTD